MIIAKPGFRALAALFALAVLAACAPPEERAAEYTAEARALLEKGDLDKARLEVRNALQIMPKNAEARYLAALIAEKKGEINDMVGHLAVVVEEDKENAAARVKLGTILVFAQDYGGAQALADQAAALTPDDAELHVLKGRLLLQQEKLPEAFVELDRAIELNPKLVDAALIRGMALAVNEPEKAAADLDAAIQRIGGKEAKALRQAKVNVLFGMKRFDGVEQELRALMADFPGEDYQNRLAILYAGQNRLDDAEAVLRQAVEADPKNVSARVALAQFQSRNLQKPELAEKTLQEFIAADPENLQLQFYLGTFYEGGNRLPEAEAAYQKVADKDPLSVEGLQARNRLAAIQMRSGQAQQAKIRLDGILQDAPDNVEALLARGEIHYAGGQYEAAISDLRGVLRKDPTSELGLLLLARTHVAAGDRALASDAYRRLLQANPRQTDALIELPALLGDPGQLEEAEGLLQQALAIDPKSSRALSGMVDVLVARNELAAAEARARELVALSDPDGLGERQLGRVLEARGEFAKGFQAYERALQRKPDSTLAFQGAVRCLLEDRKGAQAIEFIRAHLERYPDHVNARVSLGEVLLREGKMAEGQQVLNDVIDQRPDIVGAYILLATSYPNDADARIAALQRGKEAAPKDQQVRLALATEYQTAGRYEDAIKAYEELLALDPQLLPAVNSLASLLLEQRSDAESHKRALGLAQVFAAAKVPAWLDTLGWAHYRNSDFDSAVRFLELAVAYSPNPSPLVRYHLGLAYRDSGNTVGARQELEKVLKATKPGAPGNELAKEALAKLAAS